ncbi:MAG: Transglutaminase-like superfamily protein [candidate division WS6 bacterium OLB20]|uniref:Transglutaminase-like superfamily protein n=1 Tax=candidate division WS6 bacterium OLB20 TaxID=1617426 RepID=A0A136LZK6_9BACT|nr:MAG: Transglutaminase-like superfamily protein [candidate division WS6 bacterium OLB20]
MRRVLITAFLILIGMVGTAQNVSAQQSFRGGVRFDVRIQEAGTAAVTQEIDLINTSGQYLISSYTQTFPFSIDSLAVTMDGTRLSAVQEGNRVTVTLGQKSVRLNQRGTIRLEYRVSDLVVASGPMHEITWPQFEFGFPTDDFRVSLYYPESWGEVTWSAAEYENATGRFGYKGVMVRSPQPLYLVTGSYSALTFDAAYALTHGADSEQLLRIALPDTRLGSFDLGTVTFAERGIVEESGQRFLVVRVPERTRKEGTIAGSWKPSSEPALPEETDLGTTQADIAFLELPEGYTEDRIYDDLQRRLTPATKYLLINRFSITDTVKSRAHTPLDYAQVYTAAYRSRGIPAYTVYGLTRFPQSGDFVWHVWVMVRRDGEWISQDPYMQDLLGYDYRNSVSPFHIPWTILGSETDPATLGVTSIDPASVAKFSDDLQPFEHTFAAEVQLQLKGEAYSGRPLPLTVLVVNTGTDAVRISSIEIEGAELPRDLYEQQLLLPGTVIEVPVLNLAVDDPFFSGVKTLAGTAIIYTDEETLDVPLELTVAMVVDYRTLGLNLTVVLLMIVALTTGLRKGIIKVPRRRRKT